MKADLLAGALALTVAAPALADGHLMTYPYEGSFENAAFAVETAIVNQGLVIDYVSHVGDMLNRTREDVGGEKIFDEADVYLFCSAVVSRSVMEADPMNLVYCPYSIFVANQDGEITVGHPTYPEGEMQEVQALLEGIVKEALEE